MPDKSHLGVTGGTKTHGVGRMSKLQHVRIFNVFALGLLSYASLLSAQIITGEITGTVTDPSGAAVPGATVTATCTATNASRTATTGNSGSYVLSNLPPRSEERRVGKECRARWSAENCKYKRKKRCV